MKSNDEEQSILKEVPTLDRIFVYVNFYLGTPPVTTGLLEL